LSEEIRALSPSFVVCFDSGSGSVSARTLLQWLSAWFGSLVPDQSAASACQWAAARFSPAAS